MGRVIRFELRRNATLLSIICLMVFVVLAVGILQIGIENHKTDLKEQIEFVNIEMKKVERYINYHQYGAFGFRRLLESSPLMAMFENSTALDDLDAFIDNSVRLKLGKNEIGKGVFERPTGGTLDFSWYILVFGGIFVSIWGFFTFRNREYLRFLISFSSDKNVFAGIILARIILLIISLAILLAAARLQFLLNNIKLTAGEISGIAISLLTAAVVLAFLLTFAAAFGTNENWIKGALKAGVFFLAVVFLWPETLNLSISRIAAVNLKSSYKLEVQKIEKLMAFERESYEYSNRFDTKEEKIEADRRMGEKWWDSEFQKIEKMEAEMMEKTRKYAQKFHLWSIFNPVTLYKSTNNELSSRGYNAYMHFYQDGQEKQKGFLRYFLDKKRYESYTKVEPYLSKEELVVSSKSSLPKYFLAGLILSLFYIGLAVFFSYFRLKNFLFYAPDKVNTSDKINLDLRTGNYVALTFLREGFLNRFLNVLYGRPKGFNGKVSINGKNIVTNNEKKSFAYLPNPDKIPGAIKTGAFISCLGRLLGLSKENIKELKVEFSEVINRRFNVLEKQVKATLMFRAVRLTNIKTYVFHDFFKNIYDKAKLQLIRQIEALKSDDVLIVDIVTGSWLDAPDPDYHAIISYEDSEYRQNTPKTYDLLP